MSDQRPVALVTGAGSGIGRSICLQLAAAGWRTVLVGRTASKLEAVAAEIESASPVPTHTHTADVAQPIQARAAVAAAIEAYGRLDALINNAGSAQLRPIAEHTPDDIAGTFAVNALGPINMIAAALPALRQATPGVIVNVSSMAAHDPFPGLGVYGAAKAATEGIVRAIRNEETQVRAYAIAPGAVETPLLRTLVPEDALPSSQTLDPDAVAAEIVACVRGDTGMSPGDTRVMRSG